MDKLLYILGINVSAIQTELYTWGENMLFIFAGVLGITILVLWIAFEVEKRRKK